MPFDSLDIAGQTSEVEHKKVQTHECFYGSLLSVRFRVITPQLVFTTFGKIIRSRRMPRPSGFRLEASSVLGAARGIARAIGMRSRARELAAVHDQVFVSNRPALEPAFEDAAAR
jgi:hypothetical protein